MNLNIKKKWRTALTSGEYRQGEGVLRTQDDEFCCLGVLCDLAAKDGVGEWRLRNGLWHFFVGGQSETTMLPFAVGQWAELPRGDYVGTFRRRGKRKTLSVINDKGKSFRHISRLIRKYF